MRLGIILSVLGMSLFFASILFIGNKRSTYLLFVSYFLPFIDLWITPSTLGNLSVFDGVTIVSVVLFFRDLISLNRGNKIYVLYSLLFLLLILLGSLSSEFKVWSLFHIPPIVTPFIFAALLLRELKENPFFISRLISALKTSAWVGIFFMAMQLLIGIGFTAYENLNPNVINGSGFRYPGFFMDTQVNGSFMAMIAPLFLVNLYKPSSPTFKNYYQFAIMLLAVLLAGSRSPLIGLGAAIVFLTLFVGGKFRPVFLIFTIVAAGTATVLIDYIPIFQRFGELNDSLSFRASLWADAWKIFYKEYALGIGVENYQQYIMRYSQDQFLTLDDNEIAYLMQPENGYLKWLVEFGIFGTILLFLLILGPVLKVFIHYFNGKKVEVLFFFIAPIVTWLISFTSLYTLYDKRLLVLLIAFVTTLIAYPRGFVLEDE